MVCATRRCGLRPNCRGKGRMREMLSVMIPYGFKERNLNRMKVISTPKHKASKAVVNKWDFWQDGLLKEHDIVHGDTEDSLLFGLTRKEYDQMIANKG